MCIGEAIWHGYSAGPRRTAFDQFTRDVDRIVVTDEIIGGPINGLVKEVDASRTAYQIGACRCKHRVEG